MILVIFRIQYNIKHIVLYVLVINLILYLNKNNMIKKIYFVDDIFRKEIASARFCIYKTLTAIFRRSFNLNITPLSFGIDNNINNLQEKYKHIDWTEVYFSAPADFEIDYVSLLDNQALYLSYEAPLWLYSIWEKYNINYIDLRLSYLRFLPDIPVMFSTNIQSSFLTLNNYSIDDEDIIYEASICKASYNFRHFKDHYNVGKYKNSLIFIGQTDSDTSLMKLGATRPQRVSDYTSELTKLYYKYKNVFYKPHPYAKKEHINYEHTKLRKIFNRSISICNENFYNLVSQDFCIDFIGISSGALQEAKYFNKNSIELMPYPFHSLVSTEMYRYINIESVMFFSPKFWQELLSGILPINSPCKFHRKIYPNLMRSHHNESWGYNSFFFENRKSTNEMLKARGTVSYRFF